MDKSIGYEIKVRITYPADEVDIVSFLNSLHSYGESIITDVVILNNDEEADSYIEGVHGYSQRIKGVTLETIG